MSDKSRRAVLLTALCAAFAAGCGEDEPGSRSAKATSTPAAAETSLPAELAGTWTTTMKRSEFTELPPQFNQAGAKWEITFSADGGVDGAPALAMVNDELGHFFGMTLEPRGNRLAFVGEEMDCGGEEIPAEVSYALEGDELTLDTPGDCAGDAIAELLTNGPWSRS